MPKLPLASLASLFSSNTIRDMSNALQKLTKPVVLEPKTQAFLAALSAGGGKPIYTLSYAAARTVLESVQADPTHVVTKLPAIFEDRTFPVGPSGSVSARIYRPEGASKVDLPAVMYFHGGGWVLGSVHTHDRLLRDLVHATSSAAGSPVAFVFVNYTPPQRLNFQCPSRKPMLPRPG
jgi:acetyl esterase